MVQLVKSASVQTAYLHLDGYTTGSYTVKVENVLTDFSKTKLQAVSAVTNGRSSAVLIPMNEWYDNAQLHEGMYILTVYSGSTVYATRLAYIRDSAGAFSESDYTGYNGTDSNIYKVYEQ